MTYRSPWNKPEKFFDINLSRNVHFDQYLNNKVFGILRKKTNNTLHYADPYEIYKSISNYYKIHLKNLTIGFGATDILYRITKILDVKNYYVLNPTFEVFEVYCKLNFKKFKRIKKSEIYSKRRKDSALYVVNPNGVDGSVFKLDKKILSLYKYIIIDEVYADFYPKYSLLKNGNSKLIIVKSLSKSLGIAGVRIGFCKASSKITKKLQTVRLSQITSSFARMIVPKVISNTRSVIKRMTQSKKYLENKYECKKSYSNFVLFKKKNKLTKKFGSKKVLGYFRMALTNLEIIKKYE